MAGRQQGAMYTDPYAHARPYTDIDRSSGSHRSQGERAALQPKQVLKAVYLDEPVDSLPGPLTQVANWFTESKFNYMALAFPVAVYGWYHQLGMTFLFVASILSLVALSNLLSSSTDQIANHVNQTVGALLNVTFGNAIEMILAFFALRAGLIGVVKYSLLGSIVSNSIWSLGVAFITAGSRSMDRPIRWNRPAAGAQMSVLVGAIFSFVLPCVATARHDVDEEDLLGMSRGLAVLLLMSYFGYLYFSMITHADVFDDIGDVLCKDADEADELCGLVMSGSSNLVNDVLPGSAADSAGLGIHKGKMLTSVGGAEVTDREDARRLLGAASGNVELSFEEIPVLSLKTGVAALAFVTCLVCVVSEWVCDTIGDFAEHVGMSPRFVAFILLPVAGNLPEFVTVVMMAAKGKMDLCVGVAIGSAMQVATFVVPMMCILGWIIHRPLNLNFGVLETAVLFLCVLKAWNIVSKKEASWFEGATLIGSFFSIAIAFWFWDNANTPDEVGALKETAVGVGKRVLARGL
eukprot:TRINITY_DN2404_c0_g1_i1.p1 TRINITY_DN2404_c0_g1~~TRINITY_DN2404_c0_g1_i1.p1  ORF type:complete len:520 (+),score=182.63 TRINITY_DN2404_c0_g1_i1:102-1661(+)